ncbi:hypothetical protein TNCV_1288371 [Trichonephila clavipes]|nr:hypothetical protein TNCV_1288371 [Trichonephila clavipes]
MSSRWRVVEVWKGGCQLRGITHPVMGSSLDATKNPPCREADTLKICRSAVILLAACGCLVSEFVRPRHWTVIQKRLIINNPHAAFGFNVYN